MSCARRLRRPSPSKLAKWALCLGFYDCWRWRGLGRVWQRLRLQWKRDAAALQFIFAASFRRTPRSNNWDALFVLAREIKLFCGLLTRIPELLSPRYSLISLHGSGANLQRGASRSLFLVGLAPAFCAFLLSPPPWDWQVFKGCKALSFPRFLPPVSAPPLSLTGSNYIGAGLGLSRWPRRPDNLERGARETRKMLLHKKISRSSNV